MKAIRTGLIVLALAALQACSTVSPRFETTVPGATLALSKKEPVTLPANFEVDSKATGQHLFKVVAPGGREMYGLLPLRVNGGKMAGSILFFAPALAIGGFRDPFPFYEFDPENGTLRYKMTAEAEWRLFKPSEAEAERARTFFKTGVDPRANK
ncbi:MAG TPA: hypothetical protein VIN58_16095 [Roseateles sp.]